MLFYSHDSQKRAWLNYHRLFSWTLFFALHGLCLPPGVRLSEGRLLLSCEVGFVWSGIRVKWDKYTMVSLAFQIYEPLPTDLAGSVLYYAIFRDPSLVMVGNYFHIVSTS